MQRHFSEFQSLGAKVLAVTMLQPPVLAEWLKLSPLPFLMVSDPDQVQYRRFGLIRASWRSYLRPRVLYGYLRLIVRGIRPKLPNEGEDVHQLGGDFVLNAAGRVVFAFRSADPTDRPAIASLIAAIRDANPPVNPEPR